MEKIDFLTKFLSASKIKKIHSIKNEKIKYLNILSELSLKYVINKELGIKSQNIQLEFRQYGKPYLKT